MRVQPSVPLDISTSQEYQEISRKFRPFIILGTLLVVLNAIVFVHSMKLIADAYHHIFIIATASSVYHSILGFTSAVCGFDLNKCRVILVCTIIGCVGFVTPHIVLDLLWWNDDVQFCREACKENVSIRPENCNSCNKNEARYLPGLVLSLLICITDIILSGCACCLMCTCCEAFKYGDLEYQNGCDPRVVPSSSSYRPVQSLFTRSVPTYDHSHSSLQFSSGSSDQTRSADDLPPSYDSIEHPTSSSSRR